MIRTITHRNGANVNKQLVSTFNEEVKRLNADDYDYTRINTAFLQLEAYLKQLAARLNIEISISWSVSANGRVKLQLADNNQRHSVELRDLNQMFNGNFNAFADFTLQVETVYKTAANEFSQIQSTYNTETSEYADELSDLASDYSELLEAAEEADLTPEDIVDIIAEADDATKGEISAVEQAIDESLPTPPEGTIGSGVTGGKSTDELISDAQKAAEEAAQQAQERAEAEAGAKAAQEEADRAQAAADRAEAKAAEAQNNYNSAKDAEALAKAEFEEANKDFGSAIVETGATRGLAAGDGFNHSTGSFVDGVYTNDNTTYTVTTNGNDVTVSAIGKDGDTSTVHTTNDRAGLESLTESVHDHLTESEARFDETKEAYQEAIINSAVAQASAAQAQAAAQEAQSAANTAQAKADAAQQAADDANIPYATDDELENGWYNDDAEPEDTTEGNDDWGDWDGPSWGDGSVDME